MSEYDDRIIRYGRVVSILDHTPWGMHQKTAYIKVGDQRYELRERHQIGFKKSLRGYRIDEVGLQIAQGPRVTKSLALLAWPEFDPNDAI